MNPIESIVLQAINGYIDNTPLYYTLSRYVAFFLAGIQILYVLAALKTKNKISFFSILLGALCFIFIAKDERPNIGIYYGHSIQEAIKSNHIDYDRCVFGSANYRMVKKIGMERYAKAKADAIAAASANKGNNGCGRILNIDGIIYIDE